jgi:protein-S-isoprenylcysteine O-methyltransferase Ste14
MNALKSIPSVYRSIFYGVFFLVALHGIVWLNLQWDVYFPWMHVEIGGFRWIGAAITFTALTLYTITAILLCSKGDGPFAEFDPPVKLVTSGPYQYVRNPISTCVLLMIFGEAIAFSSTGVMMMVFVSIVVAQAQAVALEEPLLLKRFGEQYAEYKRSVPRWFPRMNS